MLCAATTCSCKGGKSVATSNAPGPAKSTQASASGEGGVADAQAAPLAASADAAAPAEQTDEPPPRPAIEEVAEVLFLGDARDKLAGPCPRSVPNDARFRCLFDARYQGDPKAASVAHGLWVRHGVVAGVAPKHTMDGGYRGAIALEPAVPRGADRKHLEWMALTLEDFEAFFDAFAKKAPAGGPALRMRYRFRPIHLRFMRSKRGRTPSAYADAWSVSYNVVGSLWRSPDAARETMFHEIFHLNDDDWSPPALGALYRGILARCGARVPCLTPYAPSELLVRGGTYYSFQQNNGDSVREYAADLATRFYRENRDVMAGKPPARPFKCGPPENREAWALMRDKYFGGRDLVAACP